MFGPAAATIVVALDSLIISLWSHRTSRRGVRVLFNLSAPTVAVWIAAQIFFSLADVPPLAVAPRPIIPLLVPLLVLAVVYFILNSSLIALAVALEQRVAAFGVWRHNFLWLSLNYFSGASVAALLLPYLQGTDRVFDFVRAIAFLLPLLLISYLTLKTSLGRVEDATKHLSELNRLYLSTIETLAMAIDAKDQITHGHIRRVQVFAVGLAKAMGLHDLNQIQAVEAAALLHDMGKLAVPEHILNKPGPLTPAEFDKMKLHASVGADILSAIDFPYPVVPIVRHHHENWDGTGYPDKISGTDIPFGARILSVVNCFDALTSDRPYRARLSDADALRILNDRRGTMYDPLIVDTFVKIYRDIAPTDEDVQTNTGGVSALTRGELAVASTAQNLATSGISASTDEMLLLYDITRAISGRLTLSETSEVVSRYLRRLVPATTCVVFLLDHKHDELVVAQAVGEHAFHFNGLRVAVGQRLSGWVAANRQTIVNSDPMLDLGEVARVLRPALRSCLSAPLIVDPEVVGVLTVYSTHREAFTDDHRRIVEIVGRQLAPALKAAAQGNLAAEQLRARLTEVPSRQHFEQFGGEVPVLDGPPCSILMVELRPVLGSRGQPHPDAERLFITIAEHTRAALNGVDLLFRFDFHRLVVLLPRTDGRTAESIAQRLAVVVSEPIWLTGLEAEETIKVARATAPDDAQTLADLIGVAEARLTPPSQPRASIH